MNAKVEPPKDNQPGSFEAAVPTLEHPTVFDEFSAISRRVRKRRVVLYFGRSTFSDNTKYLYLADLARSAGHEVLWCTFDKSLETALKDAGLPCFNLMDDINRTIDLLMHAAVAVFCVNPSESLRGLYSMYACLAGARKLQLWHGVSVKQLLLKLIPHLGISDIRYRRPFFMASQADLVLSTSSAFDDFWYETYGAPQLVRAGFPRNEVICREATAHERIGSELPPEATKAFSSGRRNVLVVPTWQRGNPTFLMQPGFFERLHKAAARYKVNFFYKMHPLYHDPSKTMAVAGNNFYAIGAGTDIYPHMKKFDALLTDYSSIMFDFLLTGKPVLSLDIPPGTHQNFEPDYSLVPDVPFRTLFTPANLEAQLQNALDRDDKKAERGEMVEKIFETDPLMANEHLLAVVDRLVDEAVSLQPEIIYPATAAA
ncbi:CDP-glycerol glycerophosphotransferase family protein [Mycoplana rhizolycopersici]|uniref:CDP-glycerol glycerophosphotransferase family protein n=1 Tax=Mycoplana rhizolycopersici TaxID=2746702 RepID=A0ABX2QG81_9HYPH|nr:CDP-glycerol glycerophosphotransferase family protein [Rhizobium rhizolycopersici]NVP55653.1 CDP-glycerol glycerophosphotransferase family protein [Rhizobium rhizolycopersici]